jgi:hypothetical protein
LEAFLPEEVSVMLNEIPYVCILTYEELYDIIYSDYHPEMAEAQRQIRTLTDEEWHDWIEYRDSRSRD